MANLWQKFRALLPGSPILSGEVITDHSDGSYTVTLAGGGTIRVTGSANVGERVLIRDHLIIDKAPDLPGITIEI